MRSFNAAAARVVLIIVEWSASRRHQKRLRESLRLLATLALQPYATAALTRRYYVSSVKLEESIYATQYDDDMV